jgi:oxygen-dependent protoporphyrinogen oxidase
MGEQRVAVIGGGITGLAAAHRLTTELAVETVVFERAAQLGGRLDTGPFAGVDAVDSGADAFLARVPDAVALATAVGLEPDLVSPEPVGAAVWYDGLHDIPDGLMLGVPTRLAPFARTGLISWRGKARAAVEPLLPRTSTDDDSLGAYVRARFGDPSSEEGEGSPRSPRDYARWPVKTFYISDDGVEAEEC